jgi:hypothetical protein
VNRKYALYDFFLIWYNEVIDDKAKDFWSCYFDVNFIGESGVYLGVQQDLLQTCLDQLAALVPPLFVPTEENSDRFHINRHYVPDEKSKRFIHHELKKTDTFYTSRMFKKLFLQYVGGLITRCMLAGLELPFKLSFYTLGYIYNPHFKPGDMYLLYYLLDHPVKSAETLGLLKVKPEEFQHLYMNFNTHYPITQEDPSIDPKQNPPKNPGKSKKAFVISPKNPELTLANVHEFIYRTAKYVLTTVDSKDPVVIPEKKRKHYTRVRRYNLDLLKAFRKGFYIHPEGIFTNEVVAVHVLDKMINSGGIHIDKYSSWLATTSLVVQYPDTDATTHSPEQAAYLNSLRPQQTLVADVFLKEILAKPDIAIPFDKVEGFDTYIAGKSPKEIKKIKKEFFLKSFIPNLFYFWTSSRTINPAVRYAIAFTINDPANDPYALARLPSSHTCFNTLDLPTFYPSQTREGIRDALMEKLVIAIYKNVGFGVA